MKSSGRRLFPFLPSRAASAAIIAALALAALCAPAMVIAQVLYGSLVGNVTDETGAAVPGATVTITNRDTGDVARHGDRRHRRVSVRDRAAGHLFGDGAALRLQNLHPLGYPGHAEQHLARRRGAAGRRAHRVGDRVRRASAAADGSRRGAVGAESGGARQPAGVGQPELSVSVPRAAGLHASRGSALRAVESVARARVQRQRREPQLEQHPHRRRQHHQHLAAARRGLRAGARVARSGERRDQQLRCRAGIGRRLRDQRADQERHQQPPRLGVRVPH